MKNKPEFTSFGLHLLAMALMLCDHICLALMPDRVCMTCVGRLAFPIFAFLVAEGFVRTRSRARFVVSAGAVLGGFLAGTAFMVDYFGPGVWTVLAFYSFRGDGWRQRLGQLLCLLPLNGWLLAGQTVLPGGLALPIQAFAVLALPFIWLYRGRQGSHGRAVRWLFYGFYPAHLLVLAAAAAFAN